jgi:hypothetical protein
VLDVDSSESRTYGEQEGSVYNGNAKGQMRPTTTGGVRRGQHKSKSSGAGGRSPQTFSPDVILLGDDCCASGATAGREPSRRVNLENVG